MSNLTATRTCPLCLHAIRLGRYAQHVAIDHTEQCPHCPAILPAAKPHHNSSRLTIRRHLKEVHGIGRGQPVEERTERTPVQRNRDALVAWLRQQPEGPAKEHGRRRLQTLTLRAWREKTGVML